MIDAIPIRALTIGRRMPLFHEPNAKCRSPHTLPTYFPRNTDRYPAKLVEELI